MKFRALSQSVISEREARDAGDVAEQAIKRLRLRTNNTGFIFTSASRLISRFTEDTA